MALDGNLRTVDQLREEVSLLQQKIAATECDNGNLAADLLAWRKWFNNDYKEEMLYLGSEVDRLAKLGEHMIDDDNDGVPKLPPSLCRSSKAKDRRVGPHVAAPPLPTRSMVLSASEPNLKSKALGYSGTQSTLMATSPAGQPVQDPPPPGRSREIFDNFLRRQTTQSFDLYRKSNVQFKEEVASKRRSILEVQYNRLGLKDIHKAKDGNVVKEIQEGTALRRLLKHRFRSIARGWHIALDPDGKGRMGFHEFTYSLHRMGYAGNLKELWADLVPTDGDGLISLAELDPSLAREVANFKQTLVEKYGSILKGWKEIFDPEDQSALSVAEFELGLKRIGCVANAQRLFEWFDSTDRGFIGIGDLDATSALAKNQGLDHCSADPMASPKRNRRHMKHGETKIAIHKEVHKDVQQAMSRRSVRYSVRPSVSGLVPVEEQ
jgi:hypothetical protein